MPQRLPERFARFLARTTLSLGALSILSPPPLVLAQEQAHPDSATDEVPGNWANTLMHSGRVEQTAAAMNQPLRDIGKSVDTSVIDRVKRSMPSVERFGNALKYTSTVTVSSQGAEIVSLIRLLPNRTGKERSSLLARLLNFSSQNAPEAQNFIGFVNEYGLFGAPRDLTRAREYYKAAASRNYQPAVFNLAIMAYLGKGQQPDADMARDLIRRASGIGPEASARVCGLASFIEYRRGDRAEALRYAQTCHSPLANIPIAAYGSQLPLQLRVKMLRDSIGTGAVDGYHWLEVVTRQVPFDRNFLYCKYHLINQLKQSRLGGDVQSMAQTCYANSVSQKKDSNAPTAIKGIVSFVMVEQRELEQMRRASRFHAGWSVPYLPFGAADVDLYEHVMKEAK
jgi:hypothetical protein